MTWNYRIIHMDIKSPDKPWYELHEVYYNEKGKIENYTASPVEISGDNRCDIMSQLLMMANDAHRHPVLKESKLPK
ncbi:MAG: hypothetical protein EBR82_37535 [Caulobacteraceae bacterium]|nr:hypothetical protein [Caulobacteraceae bacterium]